MNPKKTHTNKKILLYELVQIVAELFPHKQSENPYFDITQKQTKDLDLEEQLLFHKVLHSLTILNKQSRINQSKRTFETAREDVINVLHLFKTELSENPRNVLLFYDKLKEKFTNQTFTKLDVQVLLKVPKRSVERYLYHLITYDLVEITSQHFGSKNQYLIKEKAKNEIENVATIEDDIFEEANREWEDFKGFVEL
jgi:hypothetical protein